MIIVTLPAFNEEEALPALLSELELAMRDAGLEYRVIVVDDGSADATAEVVRAREATGPVSLVQHPQNLGLAAAVRTGLLAALAEAGDRDIIVTMDSDNTHAPGLILRMVRQIREGADVVIASRYQPGARVLGVPWHRQLLSLGAGLLFRVLLPIRDVKDYTCGYRAYRVGILRKALERYQGDMITEEGFACMVEILLRLRAIGAIMNEAPMILRYDLKPGKSKMNVKKTVQRTLRLLLRERFGRH